MKKSHAHTIHVLFILALFAVFAVSALTVAVMGADVYSKIVRGMNANFDTHTSLTYVTTKIRQNDGGIYLDSIDGIPALVLEQDIDGNIYRTWIFHHDGYLREAFVSKDTRLTVDFGVAIMRTDSFTITPERENLLRLNSTNRDGLSAETLICVKTS